MFLLKRFICDLLAAIRMKDCYRKGSRFFLWIGNKPNMFTTWDTTESNNVGDNDYCNIWPQPVPMCFVCKLIVDRSKL